MIKVKVRTLINSATPLSEFGKEKLPIKVSYRIIKLIREIDKQLGDFENRRTALVEKYKGVSEEKSEEISAEFLKLLDEEVVIDLDPIPTEWLNDVNISPQTLLAIEFLLSE